VSQDNPVKFAVSTDWSFARYQRLHTPAHGCERTRSTGRRSPPASRRGPVPPDTNRQLRNASRDGGAGGTSRDCRNARCEGGAIGIVRARVFCHPPNHRVQRTNARQFRSRPRSLLPSLSTASQVERLLPVARSARASMVHPGAITSGLAGAGLSWSSRSRHFAPVQRSALAIKAAAHRRISRI
jgi:hypothetical protein